MSKADVEKAVEEVMEVVEEQHFALDGTKAESKAFYRGIMAACKSCIEGSNEDEEEDDEED